MSYVLIRTICISSIGVHPSILTDIVYIVKRLPKIKIVSKEKLAK